MIITRTPFRVSFLGGGTDLPAVYRQIGGAVLSTTIDKYMYVAVNKRFEETIRVAYTRTEIVKRPEELRHEIVREALQRVGIRKQIEVVTIADVPAGTGLGSSSALTVGLLKALYAYSGVPVDPERLAREACELEIVRLGHRIGKQDQYAAAYGGLNFIRFFPDERVEVEPVVLSEGLREEFFARIRVFYTGLKRRSGEILSDQNRTVTEKLPLYRALMDLARAGKEALQAGDLDRFGKLLHEGVEGGSLVDFNRAGVPLLEIVSEPDIRSPEEARLYLQELRAILLYTGVSDVRMEEGSLRCDANVSIRPRGSREWGTLTEVKNMNSFRSVERALAYEVQRQREVLESGGRVVRETRHWDEGRGVTFSSRSKEEAHDYRYFPEPDLLPLVLDPAWVREIGEKMPELPAQRRRRLVEEYGLPAYDAGVLTASKSLGDLFDRTVKLYDDAKAVSNWLMGEVSRVLRERDLDIERSPLTPENLAAMLRLIDDGTISGKIAKSVLEEMVDTGKEPRAIVEEKGLVQISDEGQLLPLVRRIIEENPGPVADYRGGKKKALGFLVGQVMKETKGKANPQLVNELFRRELG